MVSKILSASCVGNVVTVEGLALSDVEVLSEGVGSSSGIVLLEEDKSTYIGKTSSDLKTTLEKSIHALTQCAGALNQIATSLTAILASMTGPTTAPPPTVPASIALIIASAVQIQADVTQLTALKEILK